MKTHLIAVALIAILLTVSCSTLHRKPEDIPDAMAKALRTRIARVDFRGANIRDALAYLEKSVRETDDSLSLNFVHYYHSRATDIPLISLSESNIAASAVLAIIENQTELLIRPHAGTLVLTHPNDYSQLTSIAPLEVPNSSPLYSALEEPMSDFLTCPSQLDDVLSFIHQSTQISIHTQGIPSGRMTFGDGLHLRNMKWKYFIWWAALQADARVSVDGNQLILAPAKEGKAHRGE